MGFFRAGRSWGRQVGSVARWGWDHDRGSCAGALLPRSHWQPERVEDHDSGHDTTTQTGGLFFLSVWAQGSSDRRVCKRHESSRTYPKNANSHVICKLKKKRKTHMSHVICKVHRTKSHDIGHLGALCNCLGSKRCKTYHDVNQLTHFTFHFPHEKGSYMILYDPIWSYMSAYECIYA